MLESRKNKIIKFLNNPFFNLGTLKDKSLSIYEQALTHRSYANEQKSKGIEYFDNERLEFFGNFVLGFIVSEYLFKKFDFTDGVCPKCKNGILEKRKGTRILGTQNKKGNIYWSPKEAIYYQCSQCEELTIEEELINF